MAGVQLTDDPLEVPRYREFAQRVAAGETQSQAMANSGIKGNSTIARLLKHPRVLNFIQEQRQQHLEKIDISRDDILRGFLSAIADAKLLSDPNAQIMGWREIGKFEGQYAPEKKEIDVSGTINIERKLTSMSTEDLMHYLEKLDSGEAEPIELDEDAEEGVWQQTSSSTPAKNASEPSPPPASPDSQDDATDEPSKTTSAEPAAASTTAKKSASKRSSASSKGRKSSAGGGRRPRSKAGNG